MKKVFIMLMVVAAVILSGCSESAISDDFFAMDTYMSISLEGTEEDILESKQEVFRLGSLLDLENVDKENPEVKELAAKAGMISKFTGGAFDATIAPLTKLWGFHDKHYKVPSENEIEKALENVGYDKPLNHIKYDFGAIAKGYAGDRIREILLGRGVKSAIISLGGNVVAIGTKHGGKPWKVGVKNPHGEGYAGFVEVENKSVVTSGGYERYFESDGKKYSHIINPRTGYPADEGIGSVTVVCENGTFADGLSTAFYVMGEEKTKKLCYDSGFEIESIDFGVIIIDADGNISVLGDLKFMEGNLK